MTESFEGNERESHIKGLEDKLEEIFNERNTREDIMAAIDHLPINVRQRIFKLAERWKDSDPGEE